MHSAEIAGQRRRDSSRSASLAYAVICTCIGLAWQLLTVHFNYQGNLTSLFCTGSTNPIPPLLASENIYVFPNSSGYDGQFYHYVAHDPLLQSGLDRFIDMPRVRYRRILTPGLAYLLAFGRQRWVDLAYVAVTLLFLFWGSWWLSRYLVLTERKPARAILFILTPAVLISLDRLTIDLSLTSLCIGFVLYDATESPRKLYIVLVLASLSRETGAFLTIAYCISEFTRRRFARGILFSTAILPAGLWYLFVDLKTGAQTGPAWSDLTPLQGIIGKLIYPNSYPFSPVVNAAIVAFDYLALIGLLLGFALSFRLLYKDRSSFIAIALSLWSIAGLCLPRLFWDDCCSSGRVFSPLFVLLALQPQNAGATFALPLLLTSTRTWVQFLSELLRILRGIFLR